MLQHQEETKKKIVNIARKIFTHFGFRKTTMEEIALATRKGKSSIYYYFNSKEEIFEAVIQKEVDELKSDLHKAISSIDDPIEQLKVYIKVRMRKLDKLTNFYSALNNDQLSHLDFIEKVRTDSDKDEISMIQAILEKGIADGKFKIEEPLLSSLAILTAMKGLEMPLFVDKMHGDIEKRLDHLINFLFYGIVKR